MKRLLALLLIFLALILTASTAGLLLSPYFTEAASPSPAVTVLVLQFDPALPASSPTPTLTGTPTATATASLTPAPTAPACTGAQPCAPTAPAALIASGYAAGPEDFPFGVNPLTGLAVSDPERLERRPLAIKIPNFPRAVRPQSGLSQADTVYEYYLEQGITRFIGIFYGQDAEKAGPVRSGRFFDEHIFRMYSAIFVFSGADERILDYFMNLEQAIVNRLVLEHPQDRERTCREGSPFPLCRDRSIASYNNMFADTAALSRYITERGTDNARPDLSGLRFEERLPPGGDPALTLDFTYSFFSYSRWLFNPAGGRYLRFQDVQDETPRQERAYEPLLDSLTGQVIAADNVVALLVPHEYFHKSSDTEIMQINLVGIGQAMVFRDGTAYPGLWVRPVEGVLFLLSPDGSPLPLKPGVTFYQVVGVSSRIEQELDAWSFTFGIP